MNTLHHQTTPHKKATLFALCMALFAANMSYGMEEPAAKRSKVNTQEQTAQAETHPTNPTKTDAETCIICLGKANEENPLKEGNGPLYTHQRDPRLSAGVTACKAPFHRTCLAQWLATRDTCPLCKMARPRLIGIDEADFKQQIEHIKNPPLSIADLLARNQIPAITRGINGRLALNLRYKNITDLTGLAQIPGIETVQDLNLSSNQLANLDPQIFAILHNLQLLKLNNNQIAQLPSQVFAHLPNLQFLSLYNNHLQQLDPQIFANLPNLKELDLANNQLQQLDPQIFAHLHNLETLNLGKNQLAQLDPQIFAQLTRLKILFLDNNQLVQLDPQIFAHLQNLTALTLDNNQLQELDPQIFAPLHQLEALGLSNTLELSEEEQHAIRQVITQATENAEVDITFYDEEEYDEDESDEE